MRLLYKPLAGRGGTIHLLPHGEAVVFGTDGIGIVDAEMAEAMAQIPHYEVLPEPKPEPKPEPVKHGNDNSSGSGEGALGGGKGVPGRSGGKSGGSK